MNKKIFVLLLILSCFNCFAQFSDQLKDTKNLENWSFTPDIRGNWHYSAELKGLYMQASWDKRSFGYHALRQNYQYIDDDIITVKLRYFDVFNAWSKVGVGLVNNDRKLMLGFYIQHSFNSKKLSLVAMGMEDTEKAGFWDNIVAEKSQELPKPGKETIFTLTIRKQNKDFNAELTCSEWTQSLSVKLTNIPEKLLGQCNQLVLTGYNGAAVFDEVSVAKETSPEKNVTGIQAKQNITDAPANNEITYFDDNFSKDNKKWVFSPNEAARWRFDQGNENLYMQSAWDLGAIGYHAIRNDAKILKQFTCTTQFKFLNNYNAMSMLGSGIISKNRDKLLGFYVQYTPNTKKINLKIGEYSKNSDFYGISRAANSESVDTPDAETVFTLQVQRQANTVNVSLSCDAWTVPLKAVFSADDSYFEQFDQYVLTGYMAQAVWLCVKVTTFEKVKSLAEQAKPLPELGAPKYSFENEQELKDWNTEGTKLEKSSLWKSEGNCSALITVGKLPWHGITQRVNLNAWRGYEYLELDFKANTPLESLSILLFNGEAQNVLITFDKLAAGEARHVKFKIADNTLVKYCDEATFKIYTSNNKDGEVSFFLDNIKLTRVNPPLKNNIESLKLPKQPFYLGVSTPLNRIKRNSLIRDFEGTIEAPNLSINLAKNEYESGQLTIFPEDKITTLDAFVTGLPANMICKLYLVDEVDISGTTQYPGKKITGLVPDPLLPLNEFKSSKPGENRTIFYTIYANRDAKPGIYTAKMNVKINGIVRQMPLNIEVFNFTLPEKSSLVTLFNMWSHNWVNFYKYKNYDYGAWFFNSGFGDIPQNKLLQAIEFCNEYRMGISGMPTWATFQGKLLSNIIGDGTTIDHEKYEKILRATQKGTDYVMLGEVSTIITDGKVDAAKKDKFQENLKIIKDHINKYSWKDNVYFYLRDEARTKQERLDAVNEGLIIKNIIPESKLIFTPCTDLPLWEDETFRPVDSFVVLSDRVQLREKELYQKNGRKVFWYPANVIYNPFPEFSLLANSFAMRIFPVMSFKYNVDGVLYWSANLWGDENASRKDGKRWPDVPWTFKKWLYPPGEGYLYYPGRNDTPWPSLRLENWRDGMEDYEYLTLLKNNLHKLSSNNQTKAKELLTMKGIVDERYDFTNDVKKYYAWRQEIANILNTLNFEKDIYNGKN